MKSDLVSNMQLVFYPHPALRWVAKPVPKVTPLVQDVSHKMIEIMRSHNGIGLAATQVAIPWRIFVTCINNKELVFINPEVHLGRNKKDTNPRTSYEHELCLSLPGLQVHEPIPRSKDVYVSALDINGKNFVIAGPGIFSRVIQHENDHLNGILFFDHIQSSQPLEDWLNYLKVQYLNLTPDYSKKPTFGTNEEEIKKLVELEELLKEMENA